VQSSGASRREKAGACPGCLKIESEIAPRRHCEERGDEAIQIDVRIVDKFTVMPGLVPGIHVFAASQRQRTWMAGSSPAMTNGAT
jgi:hypothetical protein